MEKEVKVGFAMEPGRKNGSSMSKRGIYGFGIE
jgi:hypothetical protein